MKNWEMIWQFINLFKVERKTRENTEETLLRLLEETCMRIETSVFNW